MGKLSHLENRLTGETGLMGKLSQWGNILTGETVSLGKPPHWGNEATITGRADTRVEEE